MPTLDKTVLIGSTQDTGHTWCRIKFDGKRLSITGVEGPKSDGDCRGSCGQIVDHLSAVTTFAEGWDAALISRFQQIWRDWHLNDMQAGSPSQTAFLRANPVNDRLNYYDSACSALRSAGLNPDRGYLHNGQPYNYGSTWLEVDVPDDVIQFLRDLPETRLVPAWV
jgi:hypothetical protein